MIAGVPLSSSINPYSTGTEFGGSAFVVRRDTFTYNMSALSAGTYYARFQSNDRVAGINNAPESFFALETTITFNGVGAGLGNSGPSILPATIDIIGRGAPYSQNLNTVDPDGTPVNVQFLGGTLGGGASAPNYGPTFDIPGIALDSSTGTVSISAANTATLALGRWVYKVRVTDGSGATAERDVLVVVQDLMGNNSPVLNPIGPKAVAVNTMLSFNVTATDPDSGQLLTLRARLLPLGAAFPDATATSPAIAGSTFTWTPVNGQEGVHKVFFEVFDDANTPLISTETVEITVGGANDPPVLDPVGNRAVANGGTLTFSISGSDPNMGQVLSYSAFFLPSGATFTPLTQTFSWTPSPAQYDSVFTGITFRITDDGIPNLFDEEAISITVGAGNQSPSIGAIPLQTVVVGQLLQFNVQATDPNATQTLTLTSLGALPAGATFPGASGTSPVSSSFSWTPGVADIGPHTVQFRVEDSGTPILSSTRSVNINVINQCQTNGDCDDGIDCTTDICSPGSPGADAFGCLITPVNSACSDSNDCTQDVCTAGSGCSNPPEALGTPCGDPDNTACNAPDTCDGSGSCVDRKKSSSAICRPAVDACDVADHCDASTNDCPADAKQPSGTPCGDPSTTECTNPDTCNGSGTCLPNNVADLTPCHGGNDNTCLNACATGVCAPHTFSSCCGNGTLESGELCDDGNQANNDGCSDHCGLDLDAYQCYRSGVVEAQPSIPPVSLVDQFTTGITPQFSAAVVRPTDLCNPASINRQHPEAPGLPDHLENYFIKSGPRRHLATLFPQRTVTVVNQFGTIVVNVVWPYRLLVPTAKNLSTPPPVPANPDVDHFTCYQVRRPKGQPRFTPIQNVVVEDQFGLNAVTLSRPTRLCLPVDKNGEDPGAETHIGHLLCYRVRRGQFRSPGRVFTNNQFGPGQLRPHALSELCVPSVKNPN